ncbi:FecR family protein [Methylobacterium sp. E-016]|uniref:FecR family protein n=1 Tax=Methylobacterium sp. E-016 TaxID=2836556 RepID=UPI001FBB6F0B|nr:FecR family protein [Methylobacterium sp. E-016]MCJ2077095.1 FecR family protein [Methylobacterium sp. E-016]
MRFAKQACTHGLAAAAMLAVPGAVAAQGIGKTIVVQNDVSRLKGNQRSALTTGESVFKEEAVQTGADSVAKIVFLDQTNLSIGPNARVSLNQYVYSEDRPAGKVALNLLKGTYRFVTGDLEKKSYQINTPVATIGVRGTTFDVSTTGVRSVVTLLEGEVRVCTRSGKECAVLNQSGSVAIVTTSGITTGTTPGGSQIQLGFSGLCAASPALCTPTRLADGGAVAAPGAVAALCGR